MIQLGPNRKNKIDLADYDYQRDIQNRLLMAKFSTFDVEVLDEILNSSLTFPVDELADMLDCSTEDLQSPLDTFCQAGLIQVKGEKVQVNKEMRKYYEFQIDKFDEDFKPGMEFFQGILNKVPIHVLPNWYSVPRTSNNIFQSIIERYLLTPKIYQRYLFDLNFDNEVMNGIMDDVFSSPNFRIRSRELREKYQLTREEFEEYLLHLEFNFVCCLSYEQIDGQWKEIVTPFYEWEEYLRFLRDHDPESQQEDLITCSRQFDFVYVRDVEAVLRTLFDESTPATLKNGQVSASYTRTLSNRCKNFQLEPHLAQEYFSNMCNTLHTLHLIQLKDDQITKGKHTDAWLEQGHEKKALFFYSNPRSLALFMERFPDYTERQLREVEKNLSIIKGKGWVRFDAFIERLMAPVGKTEPVTLKKQGRRWRYVRPEYTQEDKKFIRSVIFDWLSVPGMVLTGTDPQGNECFRLTPFGQSILC